MVPSMPRVSSFGPSAISATVARACGPSNLTQAVVVKPCAGRSFRLAEAGTVTVWPPANLRPPAIIEAGTTSADDAEALFL